MPELLGIQSLEQTARFALNFLLKQCDGIEKLLRPWRTPGYIDIHRDHLIDPLHDRVVLKDAARGCASSHGNNPFGLWHLVIQSPDNWRHLLGNASGDDHEV